MMVVVVMCVQTRLVCPSKSGSRQRAWTNTSAVYVSLTVSISPTLRNTTCTNTVTYTDRQTAVSALQRKGRNVR